MHQSQQSRTKGRRLRDASKWVTSVCNWNNSSSVLVVLILLIASTCYITWLRQFLQQLYFGDIEDTEPICDNKVAHHIESKQIFNECTKHIKIHIKIDCRFVRRFCQGKLQLTLLAVVTDWSTFLCCLYFNKPGLC